MHAAALAAVGADGSDSEAGDSDRLAVDVWGVQESLGPAEVVRPTGVVSLYGRAVRQAALAVLIDSGCPTSVGFVLRFLAERGVVVSGPHPHKRVSDALRREVARGRVIRVRRGVYQLRGLPRTTAWRLWRRWTLRCWPDARWHPERPLPPVAPRVRPTVSTWAGPSRSLLAPPEEGSAAGCSAG